MSEEINELESLKKDKSNYYKWWQEEVELTRKHQERITDLNSDFKILEHRLDYYAKIIKSWKEIAESQMQEIANLKVELCEYEDEDDAI